METKLKHNRHVLAGRRSGFGSKKIVMFRGDELSIKLITAVWDLKVGNGTDKLVLVALADYANEKTGRCWPSITALMARTELAKRTVLESLKRLEEAGHLEVTRRHRHSNMFTVRQPHPSPTLGAPAAPSWVQMNAFLGAPAAPRTVIDPSIEPKRRSKSVLQTELEAKARDLGFRERGLDESPKDYLKAMQSWDERQVSIAWLADEAAKRRQS